MRVTIVRSDNIVIVDGKPLRVDCSSVNADIHAVQWSDTVGEIEYETGAGGDRHPNAVITDISPFQPIIDLWTAANSAPPPPPPPVKIKAITRRQLLLILLQQNLITPDEAVAAAATGAMPAMVAGYVNSLPVDQQVPAQITWAAMSVCDRADPMLAALAALQNYTSDQLDALFATASRL